MTLTEFIGLLDRQLSVYRGVIIDREYINDKSRTFEHLSIYIVADDYEDKGNQAPCLLRFQGLMKNRTMVYLSWAILDEDRRNYIYSLQSNDIDLHNITTAFDQLIQLSDWYLTGDDLEEKDDFYKELRG